MKMTEIPFRSSDGMGSRLQLSRFETSVLDSPTLTFPLSPFHVTLRLPLLFAVTVELSAREIGISHSLFSETLSACGVMCEDVPESNIIMSVVRLLPRAIADLSEFLSLFGPDEPGPLLLFDDEVSSFQSLFSPNRFPE